MNKEFLQQLVKTATHLLVFIKEQVEVDDYGKLDAATADLNIAVQRISANIKEASKYRRKVKITYNENLDPGINLSEVVNYYKVENDEKIRDYSII